MFTYHNQQWNYALSHICPNWCFSSCKNQLLPKLHFLQQISYLQFKGILNKIVTIPIKNEKNCISAKDLETIAKKNQLNVIKANNFSEAIRKITSKNKKLIVCIGSLYNVGNILNKN